MASKYSLITYVIILLVLASLLRSIWFFAPIERDEGHFGYSAWLLKNGNLNAYNIDNKPIGIYLLYLIPISFDNSIFSVRLFNNIIFLCSIIFLFLLLSKFYTKNISFFGSFLYILAMNVPMLEGPLAMSESFTNNILIFIFFFLYLAAYYRKRLYFIISFLFSVFLIYIKQQNLIYIFVIPLYYFYFNSLINKKFQLSYLKKYFSKKYFLVSIFVFIFIFFYVKRELKYNLFSYFFYNFQNYVSLRYILFAFLQINFLLIISIYSLYLMFKKKDFPILLIMIFFFGFIASFLPPGYSHYYQYLLFPMIFIILYFSKYFNWKIIFYVLFISIGIAVYISSFQYPNYCIKTEFLDWQFQDICSIDDQLRYVNYVSSYSNDLLYLYNWEPYLGWLSEKKIAAFTVGCNEVLSNYYKPSLNYSNSELLYIIYQDYIRMCGNLKFKEKINDWNFIPIDNNFGIIKN